MCQLRLTLRKDGGTLTPLGTEKQSPIKPCLISIDFDNMVVAYHVLDWDRDRDLGRR